MAEHVSFLEDRTTAEGSHELRPTSGRVRPARASSGSASSSYSSVSSGSHRRLAPQTPVPRAPRGLTRTRPQSAFRAGYILQSKYRIDGLISEGGMGRVFLATHLPLDRQVVVKVLRQDRRDESAEQRFLLEAAACSRIRSRHTVLVMDYDKTEDDEAFYVAEYIRGPSLTEVLREQPRLSVERALDLAIQLASGVAAIHRHHFVHRDVKPDNIMITTDPDGGEELVKLIDFGLTKMTGERDPASADLLDLTRSGMMLGSPKYMAPEQIRGMPVDPRTDIYSLGIVLFQLLVGRPPFLGSGSFEIMNQHLTVPAPALMTARPDLPRPFVLDAIVQRCLQKNPAHRLDSAESLKRELEWARDLLRDKASAEPHPAAEGLSEADDSDAGGHAAGSRWTAARGRRAPERTDGPSVPEPAPRRGWIRRLGIRAGLGLLGAACLWGAWAFVAV